MMGAQGEHWPNCWFPVVRSDELVPRYIHHGRLLGQELAVWREDEGAVHAWENRCPHRGTRLTIGCNLGSELVCRYHGWRFAGATGQCTRIPSHPDLAPPKVLRAKPYAAMELYGFVWVSLGQPESPPKVEPLAGPERLLLRSMVVHSSAQALIDALREHSLDPGPEQGESPPEPPMQVKLLDDFSLLLEAQQSGSRQTVVLMIQPTEEMKCIVHGALSGAVSPDLRIAALRHYNARLSGLRDLLEDQSHQSSAVFSGEPAHAPT